MNEFVRLTGASSGNRYVISDIHGCFKTFKQLVEEVVKLTKSDQLFLLGDYVDRGPSTVAVLDYIMELIESGYHIYPLRGNHEDDLLEFAKGEPRFLLWRLNKYQYPDIAQDGKLKDKYLGFLRVSLIIINWAIISLFTQDLISSQKSRLKTEQPCCG
jgi:serine/threonine protein phosphatase 1